MSDTTLKLDLDPKKVIASLEEIAKHSKEMQQEIEKALKKSQESVEGLENASEKGTNKIGKFFRDLGQRVRGDLKTAFDIASITEGTKFVNDLSQGVKQVFEMERAFDRLNTRLGLTSKQLQEFKKNVGSAVAGTGQKLEDILPAVETISAKGGVTDTGQLTDIAKFLGQGKAITGEDMSGVADSIVEILKNQGQKITNLTVKSALDAVEGTRVSGAFKNADEAADAIKALTSNLSPEQMKKMGLGTRELGGLAAMSSQGGEQGQQILNSILKDATTAAGKEKLNAIFGSEIFKGDKLDVKALGNVDQNRFGQYSEQIMGGAANVDQADLQRFLNAMKNGQAAFDKVVKGTNETAKQYETATDNFASKLDRFKENLKNSTRSIGSALSDAANNLIKGDLGGAMSSLGNAGSSAYENKGTIAAGVGATAAVGLLMGGAMNDLLKKVPGGGLLGKVAGAGAAEAAGIQQVYVVNMPNEMGSAANSLLGGGGFLKKAGMVGMAGAAGYGLGQYVANPLLEKYTSKDNQYGQSSTAVERALAKIIPESLGGVSSEQYQDMYGGKPMTSEEMSKAIETGMINAQKAKPVQFTNPSTISPRTGR